MAEVNETGALGHMPFGCTDNEQASGDQPDALSFKLFGAKSRNKSKTECSPLAQKPTAESSTPVEKPTVEKPYSENQIKYNMNHQQRGMAIIINNKVFDKSTKMSERSGTDKDAENLEEVLKSLGFDVNIHHNQNCLSILKLVTAAAKQNHSDRDCFLLAIFSHGDDGIIYGTDGIIQLDMLVNPFKGDKCSSLIGKPKIFVVQACQGNKMDYGVETTDSDSEIVLQKRIPIEADIIFAHSTAPGYFSWRNGTNGSWFVQSLCYVMGHYGKEKEFLWMLTRTSYLVAYEFESNTNDKFMDKKKQIPCITSMLTKELYFHPKQT